MSLAALAGSAIQAGNLISQYSANSYNVQSQERQNEINRKFVLDMWNKENAYNSPKEQLRRLKAAGLNPGLMYEDGAAGMPAAASHSPEQTAPQVKPLNADPMVMANVELMQSQAEKNRADAEEAHSRIPTYEKSMELVDSQIDLNMQLGAKAMSEVDLNKRFGDKVAKELRQMDADYEICVQTMKSTIDGIKARNSIDVETANQIVDQLYEARRLMHNQANAALASSALSYAEKRQVERHLALFDATFDDSVAIVREEKYLTRANRIQTEVYGGRMKYWQTEAYRNQASQSSEMARYFGNSADMVYVNAVSNAVANTLDATAGVISSVYGQGALYTSHRMASRPKMGFQF